MNWKLHYRNGFHKRWLARCFWFLQGKVLKTYKFMVRKANERCIKSLNTSKGTPCFKFFFIFFTSVVNDFCTIQPKEKLFLYCFYEKQNHHYNPLFISKLSKIDQKKQEMEDNLLLNIICSSKPSYNVKLKVCLN